MGFYSATEDALLITKFQLDFITAFLLWKTGKMKRAGFGV